MQRAAVSGRVRFLLLFDRNRVVDDRLVRLVFRRFRICCFGKVSLDRPFIVRVFAFDRGSGVKGGRIEQIRSEITRARLAGIERDLCGLIGRALSWGERLGRAVRMIQGFDVDSLLRMVSEEGLGSGVRIFQIVLGPQRLVRLVVVDVAGVGKGIREPCLPTWDGARKGETYGAFSSARAGSSGEAWK